MDQYHCKTKYCTNVSRIISQNPIVQHIPYYKVDLGYRNCAKEVSDDDDDTLVSCHFSTESYEAYGKPWSGV